MTASSNIPADSDRALERLIGQMCQAAIEGRRAAKTLALSLERFQFGEPDFQVLWSLRGAAENGTDQTTLAKQLAFSPAQVSASVEKLRRRGLISHRAMSGDRRRRLWQLSESGNVLLQ